MVLKDYQNNRNFYLSAVSYINASQLLMDSYSKEGLFSDENPMSVIQNMPLYYLFKMAGELTLKTELTLYGVPLKEIIDKKKGHNLEHLLSLYECNIGKIENSLKDMLVSLNQGEFRYTEYYGKGSYLEPIDCKKYMNCIRDLLQLSQNKFSKQQICAA